MGRMQPRNYIADLTKPSLRFSRNYVTDLIKPSLRFSFFCVFFVSKGRHLDFYCIRIRNIGFIMSHVGTDYNVNWHKSLHLHEYHLILCRAGCLLFSCSLPMYRSNFIVQNLSIHNKYLDQKMTVVLLAYLGFNIFCLYKFHITV